MVKLQRWHFLALGLLFIVAVGMRPADELDRFIQAQKARRQIASKVKSTA
jgi:hypothetical protein